MTSSWLEDEETISSIPSIPWLPVSDSSVCSGVLGDCWGRVFFGGSVFSGSVFSGSVFSPWFWVSWVVCSGSVDARWFSIFWMNSSVSLSGVLPCVWSSPFGSSSFMPWWGICGPFTMDWTRLDSCFSCSWIEIIVGTVVGEIVDVGFPSSGSGSSLGSILILLGFCSVAVSSISIIARFLPAPFLISPMISISESESGVSISVPLCSSTDSSSGSVTSFSVWSMIWVSALRQRVFHRLACFLVGRPGLGSLVYSQEFLRYLLCCF